MRILVAPAVEEDFRWAGRAIGFFIQRDEHEVGSRPNPDAAVVLLETDPANEMTEVWTEFRDDLQILLLFGLITFSMIYWILGRALRPLGRLSDSSLPSPWSSG